MSDECEGTGRVRNLWAPWRMEYIDALNEGLGEGCFLCHHRDHAADDAKNYALWRGKTCFAMLNRFPYTGGHSLIAPYEHVADLSGLKDEAMLEIFRAVGDLQRILKQALKADGFNVGINLGRCAGAGLPGHLHVHLVPRWGGDTNFMAVLGDVRVIPTSLEKLYKEIRQVGRDLGIAGFE